MICGVKIDNVTKKVTQEELNGFYDKWVNQNSGFKDFRPIKIDSEGNPKLDIDDSGDYERDKIRAPFIHQGCQNGDSISWGPYAPDEFRYNEEVSKFTNELLLLFGDNTRACWNFSVTESYGAMETTYVTVYANPGSELPKVEHEWDFEEDDDDEDENWDNEEE